EGNVLEETDIAGTDAVISLIDAEGNVLDAVTIVMKGDVDGNGAISVVDAVRTLRYIVGTAELTEAQVSAADVTDDGHVGTMDADQIGRYLLQQGPFYESVHN
ncbi:MAG: dockerin type I repeat-containing protein, partial [Ruminococcus sp.]|nr:dockerin type I repeat-containing protein [Ruminococcus sp.]